MSVSRDYRVRAEALRDQPSCLRCSITRDLQVHHVVALADGGSDTADNVSVICGACHREWHQLLEGLVPYEEFLDSVPARVLAGIAISPETKDLTMSDVRHHWNIARLGLLYPAGPQRDAVFDLFC